MKGKGFARRVTLGTLEKFSALLRKERPPATISDTLGDDARNDESNVENPELREAEALFQGESIRVRLPFTRKRKSGEIRAKRKAGPKSKTAGKLAKPARAPDTRAAARGPILWRKKLAASDCERQPGHGTGGVRLTQAKFEVSGQKIDQATYFRALFSTFQWDKTREKPFVEEARVPFHITIKGRDLGLHVLGISHKPSGQASQGNYTTILKWTGIAKEVRELKLTGSEFILNGPATGTREPFFIEIS